MSVPDITAATALGLPHIKPVYFVYMDIAGDPLRANTSGADVTPSGTGDADLDGLVYFGIHGEIITVSSVKQAVGGTDSVTVEMSGIPGIDGDIMAAVAVRSNWQGREARLWRIIRNPENVQQGGFQNYYTGRMMAFDVKPTGETSTITMTIESYLAVLKQASNRSYVSQSRYDAGDQSGRVAQGIANAVGGGNATVVPSFNGGSVFNGIFR